MRHRGQQIPWEPERKLRTRDDVIADLSYNFLEKKVLMRGHWLDAPRNDYGVDAIMFHHTKRGEVENGEVRFQLKATEQLEARAGENWVGVRVTLKDLRYWWFETYPLVIIIYEADRERAFWLHVQSYVRERSDIFDSSAERVTLRIPLRNKLTLKAIDTFQKLLLEAFAQSQRKRSDGGP